MKLRYAIFAATLVLVGCGTPAETALLRPTAAVSDTQIAVITTTAASNPTATSNPAPTAKPVPTLVAATMIPTVTQRPQAPAQPVTVVVAAQPTSTLQPTTPATTKPTTPPATTVPATTVPVPSPTPTVPSRTITLEAPAEGMQAISNHLTVQGTTNFWPFEANLTAQIKDASGHVIGGGSVMVQSQVGPDGSYTGGPFKATLTFTPPSTTQSGTLEVFEASAKDGSIVAIARRSIQFTTEQATGSLTLDAPSVAVSPLPLHVAFRGANGNEVVRARLRFANGGTMEDHTTAVQGVGIMNMNWNTESAPPALSGPATLELLHSDGTLAAQRSVTILGQAQTQQVRVAWNGGGDIVLATQAIIPTAQVGTAALNELLWGPADGNLAGFTTHIPGVAAIMSDPRRDASWGYRVRLIKLTVNNGVATANFTRELQAYGPGSAGSGLRAILIRKQIEQTLLQFPSVKQVVIQIEGQPALQP
ncbi:MAG: GerMN domain-containing protein [Herpetosiphonaceae bacterium]|nr:GerMN domain-containing protein [Herpetosiphonaceae bacterium]